MTFSEAITRVVTKQDADERTVAPRTVFFARECWQDQVYLSLRSNNVKDYIRMTLEACAVQLQWQPTTDDIIATDWKVYE